MPAARPWSQSIGTFEAAVTCRLPFGEICLRGRNLSDELNSDYTNTFPDHVTIAAPRSDELSLYARF